MVLVSICQHGLASMGCSKLHARDASASAASIWFFPASDNAPLAWALVFACKGSVLLAEFQLIFVTAGLSMEDCDH